ncbi:MAG: DNA recombination protein RmuC [Pseudomonadota bacterium]
MNLSLPLDWLFIGALGIVIGLVAGLLLEWLFGRSELTQLQRDNDQLSARVRHQDELAKEREAAVDAAATEIQKHFGELATQSLKDNNELFLKLAEQNLSVQQEKAKGELNQQTKAVETLVKPIADALRKTDEKISELEKERKQAYGSIHEQLKFMQQSQQSLQHETRNLVNALRRPEVRGQWGEVTLKRLAELAGMVEHCDFSEQVTTTNGDARLRPDMVIRMPDDRELVVDVKTPLDAYLEAIEASDDDARQNALNRHARKVEERIRELAQKSYWAQFPKSPEFVILFIPGDQFLTAALTQKPDLIDDALRQNIILATPTSFVALLKAVAYGWRQLALAENAEEIRKLAEDLYDRLAVFANHINSVGTSLDRSVSNFNKAVGSLERNVLPGARKFVELGIKSKKEIPTVENVDTLARDASNVTRQTRSAGEEAVPRIGAAKDD